MPSACRAQIEHDDRFSAGLQLLDWLHNSAAGFEQLQSEPILHRGGTIHCALGRLKLEWCKRKILLGWLELELVAGVV